MGRFEHTLSSLWARTGFSGETVYWVFFALGLAALAVLIVEVLGSSPA